MVEKCRLAGKVGGKDGFFEGRLDRVEEGSTLSVPHRRLALAGAVPTGSGGIILEK